MAKKRKIKPETIKNLAIGTALGMIGGYFVTKYSAKDNCKQDPLVEEKK